MSGGSLNYLYCKEDERLFEPQTVDDLETAAAVLVSKGYMDIAKDVLRLAEYIKSATIRVEVLHGQLGDVLHAVEWYLSADYGDDNLRRHLEEYRAGREV